MNTIHPQWHALGQRIFKVLSISLFSIIWLFTSAAVCPAYFFIPTDKKAIKAITSAGAAGQPAPASHTLVLSDNDRLAGQLAVMAPGRPLEPDRHVFAAYLPVTEIVTHQSDRYVASEFSIENLLYANLKLERLITEYEGLRERSAAVLEGLDVPYIYGSQHVNPLLGRTAPTLSRDFNRVAGQTDLIAGPVIAASRQQSPAGRDFSRERLETAPLPPLGGERRAISYSSGSSVNVGAPARAPAGSAAAPSPDTGPTVKGLEFGVSQEKQLPWLIRATRSLFHYLFENKIEAVIYFVPLYGLYVVVFSRR